MPSAKPPLAVDLDGTLFRGDLFFEAILRVLFASPWKAPLMIAWLLRGRAYAKHRLAEFAPADVAALPYNDEFIAWLRDERASGREIALATASDQRAAQTVADHVGLFDRVFASDGATNLKSARKAETLTAAYPNGFAYAGNEQADVKVWNAASHAVVVNAAPSLARAAAAHFQVERVFARAFNPFAAFAEAIRPQQWVKNALVFLPMLVGQAWDEASAWQNALLAFAALSLIASSVYLVNDCADIDADRRHARKRMRAIARGALAPAWALTGAVLLFVGGATLGAMTNALPYLFAYALIATLYSFWLKRVALVDVFVLAALFVLRIVLGGVATGHLASGWLLAFTGFFFLGLALLKRSVEVDALRLETAAPRRGYRGGDAPLLKTMGVSAGLIAALVLALYLQDANAAAQYRAPFLLWALPAVVVFWTLRMWFKAERGLMHDDPLVFAFRDGVSWLLLAVTACVFAAAALGLPS